MQFWVWSTGSEGHGGFKPTAENLQALCVWLLQVYSQGQPSVIVFVSWEHSTTATLWSAWHPTLWAVARGWLSGREEPQRASFFQFRSLQMFTGGSGGKINVSSKGSFQNVFCIEHRWKIIGVFIWLLSHVITSLWGSDLLYPRRWRNCHCKEYVTGISIARTSRHCIDLCHWGLINLAYICEV